MAKIFITGATGQVGSRVVEFILEEKEFEITTPSDIVCLVRNLDKAEHLRKLGVTLIQGDLQNSDAIFAAMVNGIEYVFHIAANILLNQSYKQMYIPNVLGTRIMLEAFVKSSAKYFIYTSSIAVYSSFLGRKRVYVIDENYPLGSLKGEHYPVTKRIAEGLVSYYANRYPEKIFAITRLGPIIGAGDKLTIPSFVEIMSYKFLPKLINGGSDLFSITSPLDVARAQVFLAKKGKDISGEAFNVANDPISYRDIMKVIATYYSRQPPKLSIKYWFFKLLLPFLKFLKKIFPKFKLLQTATSPITVDYIGKSYIYKSDKIKSLNFKFIISPEEAILDCLENYDPERIKLKKVKN